MAFDIDQRLHTMKSGDLQKRIAAMKSAGSLELPKPESRENANSLDLPKPTSTAQSSETESGTIPLSRAIELSNARIRYNKARADVEADRHSLGDVYSGDFSAREAERARRERNEQKLAAAGETMKRLGLREEVDPSFMERIKKTVTGSAKSYGAQMAGAAGNAVYGEAIRQRDERGGEIKAWQDTIRAYQEVLDDPESSDAERKTANDVIGDLSRRISAYEQAYGSGGVNERAAQRVQRATDRLSEKGSLDLGRAQQGLGTPGRLAVAGASAVMQMGADIGLGAVTGVGNMVPMMLRSFGGGAQEARKKGYSHEQQMQLGLANAATEFFTEKLFGGNPVYDADAGLVNRLVDKVVRNDSVKRWASTLSESVLSEGLEEMISDVLEPVAEWAVTGNRAEYELEQIIEDGMVGVLVGAAGKGVDLALPNVTARRKEASDLSLPTPGSAKSSATTETPAVEATGTSTVGHKNATITQHLRNNLPELSQMEFVASLTGNELPAQGRASDRALAFLQSIGNKVTRQGFGDVFFSRKNVKGALVGHGASEAKIDTIAAVPDVIRSGMQLDHVENYDGRGYDTYIFGAPVVLKGRPVLVGVVVAKDKQSGRYYVHEVVDSDGNTIIGEKKPDGDSDNPSTEDAVVTPSDSLAENANASPAILNDNLSYGSEKVNTRLDLQTPENSQTIANLAEESGAEAGERAQADLDQYWQMLEGQANPIKKQTAGAKLVSAKTEKQTRSVRESAGEAWNYFKRKMLDSGEAVTRIGKAIGDQYLYPYYNMARASTNAAISMVTESAADVKGKRTGKSLNEVFGNVRAKGDDYYNAFQTYLLHLHNVDRMSRENSAAVEAAEDALNAVRRAYPELSQFHDYQIERMAQQESNGYYFEAKEYTEALRRLKRAESVTNKPVFGYDVDAEKSRAAAAELQRQHPEFADYAQDVYAYIDNLMRYRVDSGLITEADYQHLKEIYPHYVPTYRTHECTASTRNRKSVKVGSTIGQATGGTEKIMPLHEALAKQTMSVVREGSKNRFGQRLLNSEAHRAAKEHVQHVEEYDGGFSADTFDELRSSGEAFQKDNTFIVRENGRQYELTVSPALFEAVKALTPDGMESNSFTRTVRKGNDLFKRLVTGWNPTFLARNFMRDLQDAGLYSKDLSEFAKQFPQAYEEIRRNGDYWQIYKALGGTYSSIFDYETGNVKEQHKPGEKVLGRIEALNEAVEQAPRLAEFMATVKKNGALDANMDTLMEAMHNAADVTVNFGRSGTLGKQLNANYIPFLNPGIQGFDKMVRMFTETKGAKDWMRLAVKCALFGVAPSFINGLLYRDDDEWDELRDRDKDAYYLFKIKEGLWLKLPKGRTLSVMGASADRIGDALRGDEVNLPDYADFVLTQAAPANPLQENILRAWFDTDLFNPDNPGRTWYGSDIESQRLQKYAPSERYDARTDEASKWLGEKLNLSPKKINYLLDQYSGVVGDVLLPLMTPTAERDMFSAAFTIDSAASNRLSNDFYQKLDELTYAKNGQQATGADHIAYRWFNKQSSGVSEVNAAIREIEDDKTLSSKDKRELLRAQYKIRNALERSALDMLDAYTKAAKNAYQFSRIAEESSRVDEAYREANRKVFGAEYALQTYNKDVYEKAVEANQGGVSFDQFYEYYFAARNLTADKDSDGKTVSGSLKAKEMAVIDAMALTREAKDALYLATGHTESTLEDAPWHTASSLALPGVKGRTSLALPQLALPSLKYRLS